MKSWIRAGAVAAVALSAGAGVVWAQSSASSSPFSGWFGRGDRNASSPVQLDIKVSGGDDDLLAAIRQTSLLVSAQDEGRVAGQDMLAAARGDYARILGVLYDQGYYSGVIDIRLDGVEAASIAPLDAPKAVRQVVVSVQPGPRFRYSRAEIAPVAPGTDLPRDYRRGEIARTGDMKNAALAGVEGWRNVGHAKAAVAETEIIADHVANQVDSRIHLAPGPQLRFGKLTIRGEKRMDPRRLRKIAGFPEGERFDPEKLEDVRKRLRRSGVFSAITLTESDYIGPGNTLDVDLLVTEQKLRRLGAGFEYSNTDGLSLTGYWINRNLFRGGERLRVDASISDIGGDTGRDYSLGLRIDRPATITADTTGYLIARVDSLEEEDYDLESGTFGLGFTWIPSDELTADIALQYRALKVDDDSGRTNFRLLALPASVTWDKRDDTTDAKRGYWLSGGITPFVGLRDGTGSGAQVVAEGRTYYSFGTDDRFTLAGRVRLGTVVGPEIEETPRDYLFWSGGGGTVRGHSYESLGVEVIEGPEGTVKTGGMSIVTLTAETRIQIRERIGLAVFADAGRVWEDSAWSGASGWQAGAGAGIRYRTPVGPLRFDIATPVGGGDGDDGGVQVYIGLGQAF
ncbi:BamA/TamA family outer membrane protein [Paracoccus kondratievae]|uniref:Outer membrane protein assembly factor n=1 Tax=Paracoccus kondratievae TaxID=135740 RepID=A0AAD3P568_9RHOB|nr:MULTISPECIES: autotransporter assembly complex family protein [Paracoccus]QFQ87856.1 BamA/TamA family outer membrane protein [Paracoccus kondratievae]GLK66320.1 outer membrane protein assembly factor [Paracoccus kondratievae]SMG32712.1 autotransporter secretion outer membrane protein TamA [Paracoccus sp. J56]